MQTPATATGQAYPNKPIRIVAPFPPGGSVDLTARLITPKLAESLGQPVVIDNRAGASGNIGSELVARDGGKVIIANSHAEAAKFVLSEMDKWRRVIKERGMKAD